MLPIIEKTTQFVIKSEIDGSRYSFTVDAKTEDEAKNKLQNHLLQIAESLK